MSKKLLNIIMLLFISLIVSACGEEPCKRQCDKNGEHCRRDCGEGELECVAADDWGDPKIWVPAGGTNLKGDYDNGQISAPVDSGQVLLDSKKFPLVISVGKRNQWTSWFGGEGINPKGSDGKPDPYGWDNGRIVPNIECQYTVTNGSSPGDIKDDLSPATIWQEIKNPDNLFYMGRDNNYYMVKDGSYHNGEPLYANSKTPCNFRYGMGLYVGLAPDNGVGGKATSDNVILTYHIPDAKSPDVVNNQNIYFDPMTGTAKPVPTCDPDKTYTEQDNKACFDYRSASAKGSPSSMTSNANNKERGMDGYLVRGFATNELPGAQTGDRLYFKIVDSFYEDNEGGYLVRIREGTRSPAGGPLETVTGVLLEPVKVIMERIYKGIIDNQTFVQLVRAMLALYIVFYGFKFMMGMSGPEELRKDAVMRMLKIGVIVQVISPDSWAFFYSHLFGMFIDGVMQIASLLMSPFADYDPMQPWYSMDRLLAKFFSAETNAKIASTLLSNLPLGPFIIIVLYGSMILFLRALIKAVIIYIVGFIAIAILIAIAPIFIIFMLFEKTKELLEEWWGQLVAFAIQEILLMASLGMFAAVIVWFMEHTIGYTVCWNVWADFDFIGINMSGPKSAWYNGNLFAHLWDFRFWMPDISNDMSSIWMDVDGNGVRGINEFAYRYTDLPYFDPVYDKALIAKYMTMFNFISVVDVLIFIAAIFLMMNFMDFIPSLSGALKGGMGAADSGSMFTGGGKLFGTAFGAGKQIASGLFTTAKGGVKIGKYGLNTKAGQRATNSIRRGFLAGGAGIGHGAQLAGKKIDGGISSAAENFESAAADGKLRLGNKNALTKGGAGAPVTGGSGGGSAGEETQVEEQIAKDFKSKDALDVGAKELYKTELSGLDISNKSVKDTLVNTVDAAKGLSGAPATSKVEGVTARRDDITARADLAKATADTLRSAEQAKAAGRPEPDKRTSDSSTSSASSSENADEQSRIAEQRRAEQQRAADEQKRLADEHKRAAEQQRLEEESRRVAALQQAIPAQQPTVSQAGNNDQAQKQKADEARKQAIMDRRAQQIKGKEADIAKLRGQKGKEQEVAKLEQEIFVLRQKKDGDE